MLGMDRTSSGVKPLRVFIGQDSREIEAYDVAVHSLLAATSVPVSVIPLNERRLAETGMLRRATDKRGQSYDLPSNAPVSTEFAISRFLVPILAQSGWCLFTDCDMVFLSDVRELFDLADDRFAVMVVKHEHAGGGTKMDGQPQLAYTRKNWSSVVLWNCDHPANRRLSVVDVRERRGFDLHNFYWLHDSEIGELPRSWNWLVGVIPKPDPLHLAHFTLGGAWLPNWPHTEHDGIWLQAREAMKKDRGDG